MPGAGNYKVNGGLSRIEDILAQAPLYSAPFSVFKVTDGGLTPGAHVGKVVTVSSLLREKNLLGSPLSRLFRVTANGADSLTVAGDARNVGTPLPDSTMFSKYTGGLATIGASSYQIVNSDDTINEIIVKGNASGETPGSVVDVIWEETFQDRVDGTAPVYSPGTDTSLIYLQTGGWGTNWFVGERVVFIASETYDIVSNTSGTITVKGDASGENPNSLLQITISVVRKTTILSTPVYSPPNTTIELALNSPLALGGDLPQVVIPASLAILDTISGTPVFNDPTSTIVLTTGGLTPDAHIGDFVVIGSNVYTIVANTASTLTVMGDASGETGGTTVGIAASPAIQFAIEQLITDQDVAEFSAEQIIEVYDGTYTENIIIGTFDTEKILTPLEQYRLRIKAAAGETAVVFRNNGLTGFGAVHLNDIMDVSLEDLKIENNSDTGPSGIRAITNLGRGTKIQRCVLEWTGAITPGDGIQSSGHSDVVFEDTSFLSFADATWHGGIYRRCTFRGTGSDMVIGHDQWAEMRFESCLFEKALFQYLGGSCCKALSLFPATFLNCVWYNVVRAFYWDTGGAPSTYHRLVLRVQNCIFHTVSDVAVGADNPVGRVDWSHNCYFNVAKIGFIDSVSYAALADWKTFIDGEGFSPGERSIESDPKFTDPGAGDFSLGFNSQCKHAGRGSGADLDYLGKLLDPYHPDMGMVSTGLKSEPSQPPTQVVNAMQFLRRTPHLVTLKRPAITRDSENNVATRDYDNPVKTVSIRCLFQTRGGEVSIGDEGNIMPFDAKLFTIEKDIEINDRIEVNLVFYTGNFLVTAIEGKGRIRGAYSHNEVLLQKDGVR